MRPGRRLVVRNGHAPTRTVTTAAGPGGDDPVRGQRPPSGRTTGERCPFRSGIIPPWAGRRHQEPQVAEAPPLLYLHGMSATISLPPWKSPSGSAAGLSPSVVTRLTAQWQYEHHRFCRRNLADGRDVEPVDEDSQRPEGDLLVGFEQVVTPVQGRGQRPVTLAPPTAGEGLEAIGETFE